MDVHGSRDMFRYVGASFAYAGSGRARDGSYVTLCQRKLVHGVSVMGFIAGTSNKIIAGGKSMVYQWKSGSHIKANAQKAGEQFEQLARTDEGLTPESVLNANRAEGTPLHDSFEWDDTAAAEKYRLNQAGHFIRCICNVFEEEKTEGEKAEPQRAFYVTTEVSKYEPIEAIVKNQTKYEKLLDTALSEMLAFKRKYESLKELEPIFEAAERVMIQNG